jgi:hypothetical protein
MKYLMFAAAELLAVLFGVQGDYISAALFVVMGVVCLWAFAPLPKPVNGNRNGEEPRSIIKANGTQDSDLGAELWARDVADEIIREMASVSHKTEVHNGGEKPPYAKKGEW